MLPHKVLVLLALLVLAGANAPLEARGAPVTVRKGFWDADSTRQGLLDFGTMRKLGAGLYNTRLRWDEIAPTRPQNPRNWRDPAYVWNRRTTTDLTRARRWGMRVALEVRNAPRWANGDRPGNWVPRNPKDYADFIWAATH